jgi:putative nucleotidyltransferase with HDIG domain
VLGALDGAGPGLVSASESLKSPAQAPKRDRMSAIELATVSPPARAARPVREALLEIRSRHLAKPTLWQRLCAEDPGRAGEAYLEHQLALSECLSTTMAKSRDADELMRAVVAELQATLDLYLVEIQRLDDDGVLRIVASAGPLAAEDERFLITEQPIDVGVNGRVARTQVPAVITDTRLDPDYVVRDSETDPGSELSVPIRLGAETWGVLSLEEVRTGAFDASDATLIRTVATQLGVALNRIAIYGELEDALTTTLSVLAGAMEMRDPYTAAHERAVAGLAIAIANELGLEPAERQAIHYAALTHDIGKISVPSEILLKPGSLTANEWAIMRHHTIVGAEMLAGIAFFADVHPLVRGHHERWDGGGYPDRLAGAAIPLGARILCVCDSFNAMITDRPYRAAMGQQAASAELRRCSGSQFDPAVVTALERVLGIA